MSLIAPEDPQYSQSERAAREIAWNVQEELLVLVHHGADLSALGSVTSIAKDMVTRLAVAPNPWADIVGACYTSGSLQRELGIGRGAVSKAVKELRLLRLVTREGTTLYPAFQVRHGRVVPGLERVLRELNTGIGDPWTWAQWLNTALPGTGGVPQPRNIDRLARGDVDAVVRDAAEDAAAWAA